MVVKLDEWVTVGGVKFFRYLPTNGSRLFFLLVPPSGCASLVRFFHDGQIPTWQFQLGESLFEKKIWMEQGENTTYVQYS